MADSGQPFVHLRLHSAYSLLEGALTVEKVVGMAAQAGMPALALTDTNNLFGALEFSEYAAKAKIQPIIGCTLSLSFSAEPEVRPESGELVKDINHGRIALLAKDDKGYANLIKLSTEAYRYGADSGDALVTVAHLALHQEGLIALTGGPDGAIDRAFQSVAQRTTAMIRLPRPWRCGPCCQRKSVQESTPSKRPVRKSH